MPEAGQPLYHRIRLATGLRLDLIETLTAKDLAALLAVRAHGNTRDALLDCWPHVRTMLELAGGPAEQPSEQEGRGMVAAALFAAACRRLDATAEEIDWNRTAVWEVVQTIRAALASGSSAEDRWRRGRPQLLIAAVECQHLIDAAEHDLGLHWPARQAVKRKEAARVQPVVTPTPSASPSSRGQRSRGPDQSLLASLETIEQGLADHLTWKEIGRSIGTTADAARKRWERYGEAAN